AVRERLAGLGVVEEQEVEAPRRVSYVLAGGAGLEEAAAQVRSRLTGLTVDVVASAGTYVDVLPAGVNKGTTLRRVVMWLGRPEEAGGRGGGGWGCGRAGRRAGSWWRAIR